MAIDMKPERARERRQRSATAQALVDRLATGGPRRTIQIGDVELEMRLIKGSETNEAIRRAHEQLEASGLAGKEGAAGNLRRLELVECLAASICEPGSGEPLFADGAEMQAVLDETLLGSLLTTYAELSAEGELAIGDAPLRKKALELLEKKSWMELSDIAPKLPRDSLITTVVQLCSSLAQRS